MSSLDWPDITCRECKKMHSAFTLICPHCGIGPEGPIVNAPDHKRAISHTILDDGPVDSSWNRPLVRG
jgi:hypothetical protein